MKSYADTHAKRPKAALTPNSAKRPVATPKKLSVAQLHLQQRGQEMLSPSRFSDATPSGPSPPSTKVSTGNGPVQAFGHTLTVNTNAAATNDGRPMNLAATSLGVFQPGAGDTLMTRLYLQERSERRYVHGLYVEREEDAARTRHDMEEGHGRALLYMRCAAAAREIDIVREAIEAEGVILSRYRSPLFVETLIEEIAASTAVVESERRTLAEMREQILAHDAEEAQSVKAELDAITQERMELQAKINGLESALRSAERATAASARGEVNRMKEKWEKDRFDAITESVEREVPPLTNSGGGTFAMEPLLSASRAPLSLPMGGRWHGSGQQDSHVTALMDRTASVLSRATALLQQND
jgi:hypothetical protein